MRDRLVPKWMSLDVLDLCLEVV